MKRIFWVLIMMVLLCGCVRQNLNVAGTIEETPLEISDENVTTKEATTEQVTTEQATTEEVTTGISIPEETQVSDEELNAIQRVLFNLDVFIDTEDGVSKKAEDIKGEFIFELDNELIYCFNDFVYQDLNGDGSKEVIVQASPGWQYIFYELDGQIYMDTYTYKGMSDIRDDGIYWGDSGASIGYYSKITELTPTGAVQETVLLSKHSLDGNIYNYLSWDDYNNGANAISEEQATEIEESISTTRAEVYKFNRSNIENVLADWE